MTRPTANLRLFVAIHPPAEVTERLLDVARRLDLPPHREVPPEQVHVTVQFVGDTPVRALDRVTESVVRAASGLAGFTLTPVRIVSLPERGPRRLVAADTDTPAPLLEIKRRLVTRLARARREGRAYRPHLTLARFRSPSPANHDEPLAAGLEFGVTHVALMKSTLHPQGARHVELISVPLGRPGAKPGGAGCHG